MITAVKSQNTDVLDFIFNHESVAVTFCDDETSGKIFHSENLIDDDLAIFYECRKNGQTFGALAFRRFRPNIVDCHCACLPHHRGSDFIAATKTALHDIFKTTDIISAIAFCNSKNKPSMFYASLCGLHRVGELKNCYIKNKQKQDLIIYQINKGD